MIFTLLTVRYILYMKLDFFDNNILDGILCRNIEKPSRDYPSITMLWTGLQSLYSVLYKDLSVKM